MGPELLYIEQVLYLQMQVFCIFGYCVNGWTVRKKVHHVESPMEYYWELCSKNAQNVKALMCPL